MARARSQSTAATPVRQPNRKLIEQVLSDPTLYPDEMKAWMPRFLSTNVNMALTEDQLPKASDNQGIGAAGAPAFQNGWVNYDAVHEPAQYYVDPFRRVYLGGVVKSGTMSTTIFTLPVGYRPVTNAAIFGMMNATPALTRVDVNTDGTVVLNTGAGTAASWLDLEGISFTTD